MDTYISEYMVGCGSKNKHPQGMCQKVVGLHAENVLFIFDAMFNMIEGTCLHDQSMTQRMFILTLFKIVT